MLPLVSLEKCSVNVKHNTQTDSGSNIGITPDASILYDLAPISTFTIGHASKGALAITALVHRKFAIVCEDGSVLITWLYLVENAYGILLSSDFLCAHSIPKYDYFQIYSNITTGKGTIMFGHTHNVANNRVVEITQQNRIWYLADYMCPRNAARLHVNAVLCLTKQQESEI